MDVCSICKVPDSSRYIFFYCIIAKEIWLMFGFFIPHYVTIKEIITGFIQRIKKEANLLWAIVSTNILWYIWKIRNEDRF